MGIFRSGLAKTRQSFFGRISQLLGNTDLDDDTWDDIEAVLIQADVGVAATQRIMEDLKARVKRDGITRADQLNIALKETLRGLLVTPPPMNVSGRPLSIILVVGVNGSGKTTSIAKLANRLNRAGRKVMLAAGDTFRAAAIEQLQTWGQRVGVPVIAGQPGSDPAAVVYDATAAAHSRGHDILIVDTAGRLHTNYNLMEELAKIKSVSGKVVPDAPHEVLLVLDGTTGQNALQQAQKFREMVEVTGVIVTKLDGTAKGGMVFSVFNDLHLPVHYIGLGEGVNDLVLFSPENFVNSLFDEN
ncbi:MAG: signal recognition particle-docking protein FtsY [Chloroflexi bacterium]|nr:signal recognition particle-docking protein FtsY [Chloroflexota bacterium]MDL1884167.1 signal recognition particle-docking protein FtsY [Anaerolineae bacterium CFX8]GIL11933.1 MAG: signal recognition particle-docking protein FtsY [Chloroflexota bacterium]